MKKSMLAFFMIMLVANSTLAADLKLVREYVKKAGFRKDIEQGLKLIKVPENKADVFKRFVDGINFNAIEDNYVDNLSKLLTNEEAEALIKSLDIKGLNEALKKQGMAAAAASDFVAKEIEKSGKAAGLIPQQNSSPSPSKKLKK